MNPAIYHSTQEEVLPTVKQKINLTLAALSAKIATFFASIIVFLVLLADCKVNFINSDMKKIFILAAMTIMAALVPNIDLYAQSCAKQAEISDKGKTCEPEKCKPGDTKKQEAAVISGLRNDLLAIGEALEAKSVEVKVQAPLIAGKDDDETLDLMIRYMHSLHKDLVAGRRSYSLEFGIPDTDKPDINKAQVVAVMKDYVTHLKKWINSI